MASVHQIVESPTQTVTAEAMRRWCKGHPASEFFSTQFSLHLLQSSVRGGRAVLPCTSDSKSGWNGKEKFDHCAECFAVAPVLCSRGVTLIGSVLASAKIVGFIYLERQSWRRR